MSLNNTSGSKGKGANEIMTRARKHVELQIKKQEDERRRILIKKRVEVVNRGVQALNDKKFSEAAAHFRNFIALLEDWKAVPGGALGPSNFDAITELGDLLLVTGVFWELTKIFDQMPPEEALKDFRNYLGKYVIFSKGAPYQTLCAESVRRYMKGKRVVHVADFKNAYTLLGGKLCFVANSLADVIDARTLPALRYFRDETLERTVLGGAFITAYYRVGPCLASLMDEMPPGIRRVSGAFLDLIARLLISRQASSEALCRFDRGGTHIDHLEN